MFIVILLCKRRRACQKAKRANRSRALSLRGLSYLRGLSILDTCAEGSYLTSRGLSLSLSLKWGLSVVLTSKGLSTSKHEMVGCKRQKVWAPRTRSESLVRCDKWVVEGWCYKVDIDMTRTRGFCVKADNSYRDVTGSLLISFDGDDGDVVEVRALTLPY